MDGRREGGGKREGGREKEREMRRARGAGCEKRREMRRTWKEKRKDESGGGVERRTKKRPRCIRCLAETTGRTETAGNSGRETEGREEERKECICGLLDRVGGRVRRLGRALRWWEPRPRERTQAGQPGADLNRRNVRTNGNSAYTYYRIHCRERRRGREKERENLHPETTATRWEFAVLARTLNILV